MQDAAFDFSFGNCKLKFLRANVTSWEEEEKKRQNPSGARKAWGYINLQAGIAQKLKEIIIRLSVFSSSKSF